MFISGGGRWKVPLTRVQFAARFTLLPITPDEMLPAPREKERQGVATFRFPDDMPDFPGPRTHEGWPGPTGASDEESFFL